MRHQLSKLVKKRSTKSERVFAELLKSAHILFKTKVKIAERERDFVIGTVVVEINGHAQDEEKNNELVRLGYTPIHFSNDEILNNRESITKILHDYKIETKWTR